MFEVSLTPEATSAFLVLAYLFGVALRILWPYAVARMVEPQDFDWQKAKGQIVAAAVGLVGIVVAEVTGEGFVAGLGALGFVGAVISGYGLTAIGRQTQKTADLRK
jgi:hypothetical protein